jgi:hypothetical protein
MTACSFPVWRTHFAGIIVCTTLLKVKEGKREENTSAFLK